ncbi:MAG: hypothetical protein A2Z21_07255 [Candidatus Fraserbacteria bacterium RBG_16_55_9]|uniref:Uncharacterized protein n=1 Tax=Fraserbacteria sp. (strain RBG_16_55_9) TaxID=1817864 RepID=A0A1F5UTL8_FRAXR|nr:MAG: hypothetical protein A2Z21_07255 [Candidatus Fraserbacteria bacterium RBG_16_55_9]
MPQQNDTTIPPVPVALLLCDQIIVDELGKKKSLIGLFDRIWVGTFPTTHSPCALYFRGADAEGHFDILVQYVQSEGETTLGEVKGSLDRQERGPIEFLITFPPIPIPNEGRYEFRLYVNGVYVHRVQFTAVQRLPQQNA